MHSLSLHRLSCPHSAATARLLRFSLLLAGAAVLLPSAWPQNSAPASGQNVSVSPSNSNAPATTKETNDRINQLALLDSRNTDYVLNSGDLVGIEVFDVAELTRDVRISDSGYISLPLLPVKVRAAGLTAFQLQDKIAELLLSNGLVSNPQVTVTVKEQHGDPITVIGAVRTPMAVPAPRPMSLLEALSRAGGITDDAAGEILITRAPRPIAPPAPAADDSAAADGAGVESSPAAASAELAATSGGPAAAPAEQPDLPDPLTLRISLNDLLDTGDPKYNVTLMAGDVVSVPRAGVVYAVGGLQKPGGFVMASDRQQLTVLKVLSLAGGWTPTAKPRNAVIIRQSPDAQQKEIPVDLERLLARKDADPGMQQSDILFVPVSGGKQAMGRVAQAAIAIATGVTVVRLGK